jgi:hypothetical protein
MRSSPNDLLTRDSRIYAPHRVQHWRLFAVCPTGTLHLGWRQQITFLEMLGIDLPIIQAPMAGVSSPAACSHS